MNEAHYFGDLLPFSLISPNQLRDNNVQVDEHHQQHAPDSIFGILVPSEATHIPFNLEGVIASFDSRPPTQEKRDNVNLHVELTSDVEWIPHSFTLSLAEEDGEFRRRGTDFKLASSAPEGFRFKVDEGTKQSLRETKQGDCRSKDWRRDDGSDAGACHTALDGWPRNR
jgi:hypothetical protein